MANGGCVSRLYIDNARLWDASDHHGHGFSNTAARLDLKPYTTPINQKSLHYILSKEILEYRNEPKKTKDQSVIRSFKDKIKKIKK